MISNSPSYFYNTTSNNWEVSSNQATIPVQSFSTLSFNVLFDEWRGKIYKPHLVCSKERYFSQFEHFQKLNPDILILNEVTANYVRFLLEQDWVKDYYLSDIDGSTIHNFGNLVLSKYPIAELKLLELPQLSRPVVLSKILFESKTVLIAAAHLSAQIENHEKRQLQIKTLCSMLKTIDPNADKLILGDVNYHREVELVPQGYMDCWKDLYANKKGFTFDGTVNTMIHELWPLAWIYGFKDNVQMRLDRVFLNAVSWKASRIEICINQPVYEAKKRSNLFKDILNTIGDQLGQNWARNPKYYLFPSDHFGLFSTFELD